MEQNMLIGFSRGALENDIRSGGTHDHHRSTRGSRGEGEEGARFAFDEVALAHFKETGEILQTFIWPPQDADVVKLRNSAMLHALKALKRTGVLLQTWQWVDNSGSGILNPQRAPQDAQLNTGNDMASYTIAKRKSQSIASKEAAAVEEFSYEAEEEEKLGVVNEGAMGEQPPAYEHIPQNVYTWKKPKRTRANKDEYSCLCDMSMSGTICGEDCLCVITMDCCSKTCICQASSSFEQQACQNRAFQHRRVPRMKVVKTKNCGWGVVVEENVKAGDFVSEYVGEVIDDATCERRLWDAKMSGESNFYLCQISKDKIIDARHKGNISRFINHSCDPNLEMNKWAADGEARVALFAMKEIPAGSIISFDYNFVQFGDATRCRCGYAKCKGHLGSMPKSIKLLSRKALGLTDPESKPHGGTEACMHTTRKTCPEAGFRLLN